MNKNFLPIGSVCTLKGKNKKVMITGFYSVQFNGNLKIDDYSGCAYPEGLLLPEFTCNFNHSDIEKVDFVGYQNDDQRKFNALLNRLTNSEEVENIQKDDWVLSSSKSYSKLLFDENGVVVLAEPIVEEKEPSSKIKFNNDGIVISDESSKIENPFYKDYSSVSQNQMPKTNDDIFNKYKFDENGIVIGTENDLNEKKESSLNKIEFDENGIVISDGSKLSNENASLVQYKFDENGILIAVGTGEEIAPVETAVVEDIQSNNKVTSNYKFDENGTLVSEETYEFDGNGNLVATNISKREDDVSVTELNSQETIEESDQIEDNEDDVSVTELNSQEAIKENEQAEDSEDDES